MLQTLIFRKQNFSHAKHSAMGFWSGPESVSEVSCFAEMSIGREHDYWPRSMCAGVVNMAYVWCGVVVCGTAAECHDRWILAIFSLFFFFCCSFDLLFLSFNREFRYKLFIYWFASQFFGFSCVSMDGQKRDGSAIGECLHIAAFAFGQTHSVRHIEPIVCFGLPIVSDATSNIDRMTCAPIMVIGH